MRFLRLVAFMGLILGTSVAFGQDELLRGQIIDGVSRQPLIGATVQIRGTSRGSVTDEKGGFELEVALLPLALRISYVGYEIKEVTIDRLQEGRIVIALLPKSETLDEVVVSAEAIVTPITDTERYSVVDFIIAEQFILTLEFHGTFKDYRMTVHDLDGKARYITVLNDINQIEGLYRSCNDHAYLLTELDAFELRLGQDSLTVQQIHERATFETLVRPCKAVQDSMAYYVFEQAQGLVRIVKSFNTNTQKSKRLRTIADQDQISNAMMDLSLIVNGATINPIMYQDDEDVKIARAMQAESDFLRRVFYKPEYPVYLFGASQQVYLLNHPNKQLEVFQEEASVETITLPYVEDKKWEKQVIEDPVRKEFFVVFKTIKGYILRQLNTATGETKTRYLVDGSTYLEKLLVHDGKLYYLRRPDGRSSSQGIFIQE